MEMVSGASQQVRTGTTYARDPKLVCRFFESAQGQFCKSEELSRVANDQTCVDHLITSPKLADL